MQFSQQLDNAIVRQVARELHSVTRVFSQFFVAGSVARSRTQLYFSQRIAATDKTPLHSVSPLQQLVSQCYGSFSKGACAHFLSFVPRRIARQVAKKIARAKDVLDIFMK